MEQQVMVISVMAKDRPGIVAEVTEGISSLRGNLADLRETVLCGYFTMILIAGFPEDVSLKQVENALAEVTDSKVSVEIHKGSLADTTSEEHAYILSAVGKDRVGLVAQVSRFCFEQGVNIVDFASHVEDDQYTMMLQIDLSNISSVSSFREDLIAFGERCDLNIVLQHNDIFQATNEI